MAIWQANIYVAPKSAEGCKDFSCNRCTYDPSISRDPAGSGNNWYAYAGNNPVSNTGPAWPPGTGSGGDSGPPFSIGGPSDGGGSFGYNGVSLGIGGGSCFGRGTRRGCGLPPGGSAKHGRIVRGARQQKFHGTT